MNIPLRRGLVMTINYLLYISDFTKCKTEQVSGTYSLLCLLNILCEKHGTLFREKMMNREMSSLNEDIMVLVNGMNITLFDGINTMLQDDDTITFLPMVMGG